MPDQSVRWRQVATWCLAITAASLPAYVVRFHIGPLPSTLLEAMIGVTVVVYLLMLWTERRRPSFGTPFTIPIALLLVAGVGGVVVAPDHARALGIYRAYFIEAVAIFYVAIDLVRSREQLWLVLIVAGVGDCVFAVGQLGTFGIALAHHAVHIDAGPAFLNTSANDVALFLEPPLAFAVGLSMYLTDVRQRLLALAYALLFLIGIVLSLSRASYLALLLFAVVAIFSLPSARLRLWSIAGVAVIALAVLEVPLISQRLGTLAHSSALRVSIFTEALKMLRQRPVFGAGISGFPIRVAPFRPSFEEVELYPHNLWLTTWSELGLLGLISFAVIFFGLLWRGFRHIPTTNGLYRGVVWGSVGALVMYLVHGMFDSPYWKNDLSVLFWLVAALQVVAIRIASSSERSRTRDSAAERTKA